MVYVPNEKIINENSPEYNIISELSNNNSKNIKIIKVSENQSIIMIKKDKKKLENVLKLDQKEIEKIVALFRMGNGQILAFKNKPTDFIKNFSKYVDEETERIKENSLMYR